MFVRASYTASESDKLLEELQTGIHKAAEQIVVANENTKLISSYSHKQKILALNANIEAARSGEAGKGFSVVATEVERLAQNMDATSKAISDALIVLTETINNLNSR
ncbi:MAG: methyl-accepting chemotaxis protein [Butyrivibrio sp.]|nr:methyl-accepting chemotaxis protein [Butyrivibrio sp.]